MPYPVFATIRGEVYAARLFGFIGDDALVQLELGGRLQAVPFYNVVPKAKP
jgi:hypothetical protein